MAIKYDPQTDAPYCDVCRRNELHDRGWFHKAYDGLVKTAGACACDLDELHCAAAGHAKGPVGDYLKHLATNILAKEESGA